MQDKDKYFGGVVEPWWVSSLGVGVHVPEGIPLFYSWNNAEDGQMCLSAKYAAPYFVPADTRQPLRLEYSLCLKPDAREMQGGNSQEENFESFLENWGKREKLADWKHQRMQPVLPVSPFPVKPFPSPGSQRERVKMSMLHMSHKQS